MRFEKIISGKMLLMALGVAVVLLPDLAHAASTGGEFEAVYNFVHNAATGYLGRAIAIVGGIMGLGIGAATGKATPAIVGIVLAIFGSIGPTVINAIFHSAVV